MIRYLFVFLFLSSVSLSAQTAFEKGNELFQQKKYVQADQQYQKALEEEPGDLKIIEKLGDVAAYEEHWDEAAAHYKELVDREPNNANYNFKYGGTLGLKATHISRVKALFYVSDIKKYLKKAAELDPNHVETRWALVELYLQLPGLLGGSVSTAEDYADQLVEISPLNGYFSKGRIAEYEEDDAEMRKYYKKALEYGDNQACIDELANLEKSNPSFPKINYTSNACKIYKENYLNYQIGKSAAECNFQNERGLFYMQRYIDNYSKIDGVPKKWGYLRMALLYKNMRNKKKSLLWVKKALNDDPDFERAKDMEESIKELR